MEAARGDAAAATWMVRGRVAAAPRAPEARVPDGISNLWYPPRFMRLRAAAPPAFRDFGDLLAAEATTVARQGLELADQLPDLLGEIARGAREFEPAPAEMRTLLRDSFRADDVLVVQYDDDAIDESDELYSVLRDAAVRKAAEARPGVADLYGATSSAPLNVRLARASGTHLTPLTQDIFLPAERVAAYASAPLPSVEAPRAGWLRAVDDTWAELEDWLEGGV